MVGCEELTAFLNSAANLPILFWKYSFDVLSSLSTFFLLDQNFSTLWLDSSLCDAATVWCWYCIYGIYKHIYVKGTCLISKACMKNSLKGIISASVFQNRRLFTKHLQFCRAWNDNDDGALVLYACFSSH